MGRMKTFSVNAKWDSESDGWVLTSKDIPGLALGAKTNEDIERKLSVAVPPLLDAHKMNDGSTIQLVIYYEGERSLSVERKRAA